MGGREGSRGYLYQSIVTVLSSLLDESWKSVQVEPNTDDDKVDILWKYEDHSKKVVQVKSSQNNIERAQIIKWLEELTTDVGNAEQYELLLIGNVSDTTSRFISKVNRLTVLEKEDKDFNDLENLSSFLSNISIKLENFNMESLESRIEVNLNKLLTKMGHLVNPFVIEQIAGGIIHQFNKFSTEGRQVSRDAYLGIFQDWVYYNYPEVKGTGLVKKRLVVDFYYKGHIDFRDRFNAVGIQALRFLDIYKNQLIDLIGKINSTNLQPKKTESNEQFATAFGNGTLFNHRHAEYPDHRKDQIREMTKDLLGIEIQRKFFYVGELKEPTMYFTTPFMSPPENQGTEQEKLKGNYIDKFCVLLDTFEKLKNYLSYLDKYIFIPLVLRNTGSISEEDIQVILKFPSNVEVLTDKNIIIPNTSIIDELIDDDGLLELILKPEKDYQVEEYQGVYNVPSFEPPLLSRTESSEEKKRKIIRRFKNYIENLFSNQVFDDKGQTILRYEFDNLNSNRNIHFPSFVLLDVSESFSVKYEITSKNLGTKIIGDLYIDFK